MAVKRVGNACLLALTLLEDLQGRASSSPFHLFQQLTQESQELNPHGFGCLGHRNGTWVSCLLLALQLEDSTPVLEIPESVSVLLSVPLAL